MRYTWIKMERYTSRDSLIRIGVCILIIKTMQEGIEVQQKKWTNMNKEWNDIIGYIRRTNKRSRYNLYWNTLTKRFSFFSFLSIELLNYRISNLYLLYYFPLLCFFSKSKCCLELWSKLWSKEWWRWLSNWWLEL
jgi:hypothetical protein